MTLITRISNQSRAFIASDNQLNFNDGKTEIINKSFYSENLIGASAGFLVEKKLGFNLMNLLSAVQNPTDIVEVLDNQIPPEKLYEKVCILFSTLNGKKVNNFTLIKRYGKVRFSEKQQKCIFNGKVYQLITNDYRKIKESFDPEFYTRHVDFNFSYEEEYDCFFHTIFHICSYNYFGVKSINCLFERNYDEIRHFIIHFYNYMNGICQDNLGEYYRREYSNSLKTIGKCNSVMQIDVETGASILYQDT